MATNKEQNLKKIADAGVVAVIRASSKDQLVGITEALLTLSLIAVHVEAAHALFAVVAYRTINFLAPMLPALLARSSLSSQLEVQAKIEREQALSHQAAHPSSTPNRSEPS